LDTQSYIDSGILELYAMDALPADQKAEVERRAALDPAIAREIEEIREVLAALDGHHRRAPRRELRAEILDAIDRDEATARAPKVIPIAPAEVGPIPGQRRYALAASWLIAVLGVGAAAYFGVQWRGAVAEAEGLREENRQLAIDNARIASQMNQARQALAIVEHPSWHALQMKGTEHAPSAHPVVYWNPETRELRVVAKNLPPPPPDKKYQMWAIHAGQRIDVGVFDVKNDADAVQRLKDVSAAEAFAVTLERKGGSPTPDLNSIYAVREL
jgi:anti-sigma-K factor RskA